MIFTKSVTNYNSQLQNRTPDSLSSCPDSVYIYIKLAFPLLHHQFSKFCILQAIPIFPLFARSLSRIFKYSPVLAIIFDLIKCNSSSTHRLFISLLLLLLFCSLIRGALFPGTSPQPVVNPTTQASRLKLKYFPYDV
jgi:hypothetical protein